MAIYVIVVDNFANDSTRCSWHQMFFTAMPLCFGASNPRTFLSLAYTNEMLANIFLLAFFARAYACHVDVRAAGQSISVTVIASTGGYHVPVIPNAYGATEMLP